MASANGNNQTLMSKMVTTPANNKAMTPAQTVQEYLRRMGPEIARALPKHMDADRLARIALTTIRTTPKLLDCNIQSLMGSIMQAAQLGLEPGLLGHCYIIPYGREAQFIIGYKGMIDLARRSGNIQSIYAQVVYENDTFRHQYGLHPDLEHIPCEDGRGDFKGAYAVAHFKDGGYQFEYMPKAEIDKRRKRSKASGAGPWVSDYEEMAMKTVLRHMWKYLPISVEIMKQVSAGDETVKKEIAEDMADVPDYIDVQHEEGAVDASEPRIEQMATAKPGAEDTAETMAEKHKRLTKNL